MSELSIEVERTLTRMAEALEGIQTFLEGISQSLAMLEGIVGQTNTGEGFVKVVVGEQSHE